MGQAVGGERSRAGGRGLAGADPDSQTDELLPATLSETLFERMCTAGQVVERRTYDAGQTHMAAAPAAFADGFTWIDGLMNDTATARSTCP